ncbi:pilus assembly protein PilP [Thiohalobacter sp. IOR34]|uniref:pilus assembly protein PilP n=1 Tax=Thiohalobacter sp. IOR34 TaxID=3057176 RepID=UPI0025AEF6F8|nr:pilus assembly protein PilP [Thiohalobacter sp. IOR34]WJW75686.1 pilus assembly protein PilP [Thiohalobacter sp. IOR34]
MMRQRRPMMRTILVLACSAVLGACSQYDTRDLEAWVKQVRSRQQARIEPLPEFKPYETFLYQAGNLRSPFSPGEVGQLAEIGPDSTSSGIHPDANRPREALEDYPLDSLRMVGTLEQGGQAWGLVQTSDGTIHRVKPGNYLGKNHGKITRITEYEIELTEIIPDGLGGWMERPATLALSE